MHVSYVTIGWFQRGPVMQRERESERACMCDALLILDGYMFGPGLMGNWMNPCVFFALDTNALELGMAAMFGLMQWVVYE